MKVIIVGGVAGGASCAARLRRLDEKAEIIMVERGPYVSYANCGLPYHVGDVIKKESSLLVANEADLPHFFAIEVRTNCEAIAIDPKKKTVDLRDVKTGEVTTESYDKLVLSPGAASVHPPLPGIDLPGIFHVRTVPDARAIREWVEHGTISWPGCTTTPGFRWSSPCGGRWWSAAASSVWRRRRTWSTSGSTSPSSRSRITSCGPLDPEIACLVQGHIKRHGVKVVANDGVVGFKQLEGGRDRGADQLGQDLSGGHRDSRHRRATGHDAGQDRPASPSANAAASAWTSTCARATRTSSPSAMRLK